MYIIKTIFGIKILKNLKNEKQMSLKIIQNMQELLKKSEKFCDKDGNIFVLGVLEAVEKIDIELVRLLIGDEKAKEQFFTKVEDVFVLNQNKLIEFFTMNEFSKNSYTSYTNKIGLIKKDNFIKKFDDVVLAWPHKDCILEGGQSKDDDKKNEVFYNEILSREEIDRLFEPKALTNFKKFSAPTKVAAPSGSEALASPLAVEQFMPTEITENDNLIIKGNNLIALHSLKKKYAGKVKLIYIDPPYNTGNDSFKYNDRFNHSTWLTFMKNRLEVAREFLSEDGVIFVSVDDNEQAYLKILMDEIFGRNNFISCVAIMSNPRGRQSSKHLAETHEYGLIFGKNIANVTVNGEVLTKEQKKEYSKHDENGIYREIGLRLRGGRSTAEESPTLHFPIYVNEITKQIFLEENNNCVKVIPQFSNGVLGTWRWSKSKIKNDIKYLIAREVSRGTIKEFDIFQKDYLLEDKTRKVKTTWIEKEINYDRSSKEQVELFDKKVFDYAKPVYLLKKIIRLFANEKDIILDFHAGSGTTAHAILDINKEQNKNLKFILIEQMDYIQDITCERVKKVIEKNQEGSFIYAELKQIETFKDSEIGKLNSNMHYLPFAEIEDAEYGMSEEEIKINKRFYGLCDE